MLELEFDYYKKHQDELVAQFNGKYLLIVGEKTEGVYDTEPEAYLEGKERFGLGKFLIQYCSPGENNYTSTFHSRLTVQG